MQGCYCERMLTTGGGKDGKEGEEKSVCFGIMYRREHQRQYELRADTVSECKAWIDAIKMARWVPFIRCVRYIVYCYLMKVWLLIYLIFEFPLAC